MKSRENISCGTKHSTVTVICLMWRFKTQLRLDCFFDVLCPMFGTQWTLWKHARAKIYSNERKKEKKSNKTKYSELKCEIFVWTAKRLFICSRWNIKFCISDWLIWFYDFFETISSDHIKRLEYSTITTFQL